MRSTRVLLGVLAALSLSACSDDQPTRLPAKADSGFRIDKHAFAFENFSSGYDGSTMNADLAARMFGRESVCQPDLDYCVATTEAQDWIDSVNEAMYAGRCEGFAVLSQLFFLGRLDPRDFGADAASALSLDENYALQKELAYWYATQLVPSAVENTALMPRDALTFMAGFMKEGSDEFYRIGMVERTPHGFGTAHSVTPIGFYQGEASNIYYVRVYDNNFPASELHIRLDVDANTWEYRGANAEGEMLLSGGESTQNPLYFAPTVAREGVLACPFCKDMNKRTLIAHGASPLVQDASGNMVGIMGGQIIEGEGGSVTPGFSMCVDGVAPVVVSSNTPADMPVEVTLNPNGASYQSVAIQGGSLGSLRVGGDLTSKQAAQLQVSSDSVSIQPGGGSTTVRFTDKGGNVVDITVRGEAGNVKVTRDPSTGKLSVDTNDAEGAQVQVTLSHPSKDPGTSSANVSYSFTAGEGESSLEIDTPAEGWDGKTAPTATVSTDGAADMPLTPNTCTSRMKDGDETDIDCGGSQCGPCFAGRGCAANRDCSTGICGGAMSSSPGTCVNYWEDGLVSGDETDVDCGGQTTWVRCKKGKHCQVSSDCVQPDAITEGGMNPTSYTATPYQYCRETVCTPAPLMGGIVAGDYPNLRVRLTPDGYAGDASVERIAGPITVGSVGIIRFDRTMVTGDYKFEVVQNPSTTVACWVSQNATGNVGTGVYFAPKWIGDRTYDQHNGFVVSCDKVATLCSNGVQDRLEAALDCGGAECNGIGKYCAVGAACATDADCGAPQANALCVSGTCKKTYDVRGSLYTTVPITLNLTPGGNLGAASTSARTLAGRPADTRFSFDGTRVIGSYDVTVTQQAGTSCSVTGGHGDATGVAESYVDTTSVRCTSCTNGAKEGKETDVDCGGTDCVAENKLCAATKSCLVHADCESGTCDPTTRKCLSSSCSNSRKDGTETDVDCGGTACVSLGSKCGLTLGCGVDADCTSGICDTTSDTCVSCSDGAKNGAETAVDCGGSACVAAGKTCALTQACGVNADCASGICDPSSHTCASCSDGAKNGAETAVDCGGSVCVAQGKTCGGGQACGVDADCDSNLCSNQVCSEPASWSVVSASTFGASTVSDAIAVTANDIWAAGGDTLGHYDGASWSSEQPLGAGTDILGLFARADGFGGSEVWVSATDNIMKHWNGSDWFTVQVAFTGTAAIHAIHGTESLVLAVGSEGQVGRYDALNEQFTSEFGSGGPLPGPGGTPPPTFDDLFAVFVLDDSHAWAAGANGTIIALDTGFWSKKTTPVTTTLRSLWASAADDVWAVGDGGVILHYDGVDFTEVSSGTTQDLACVWGADDANIWAVGANGTIRYSFGDAFGGEDAGTTSDLGVVFGFDTTRWAMGASTVLVERN